MATEATEETIKALRRLINQPDNVEPYTDEALDARLERTGDNLRELAREIWLEKAASYADLTDVQEGSSRRALGDLYEQSLAMAEQVGIDPTDDGRNRRRSRTRPIVRP